MPLYFFYTYCSKRSYSECQFGDILEGKRRWSSMFSNSFCYFNYWAWVIKLKSCLHIVMPFAVANYCLNTSPHRCKGVRWIQYTWLGLLDRVIMVLIAILPVQKSENAVHLTGHKDSGQSKFYGKNGVPAGTGFQGSKFRDFSVPPGHMACMGSFSKFCSGTQIHEFTNPRTC